MTTRFRDGSQHTLTTLPPRRSTWAVGFSTRVADVPQRFDSDSRPHTCHSHLNDTLAVSTSCLVQHLLIY
eukprot:1709028-Amphidinium_carterae.1